MNRHKPWHHTLPAVAMVVLFGLSLASPVIAEPPTDPVSSFRAAKKIARNDVYADHAITLYCECAYVPSHTVSGGLIDSSECGYAPRKNPKRGRRLEWEHIMPASIFGTNRTCWRHGHDDCVTSKGKAFKGRRCCAKVDEEFERMEADLHNLAPSVGELNGDRTNLPYDLNDHEDRLYGACDFEVDRDPGLAEPMASVQGDVARVWQYMIDSYRVSVDAELQAKLTDWSANDPPDDWERERDARIAAQQGNNNPFITP